MKHKKQKPRPVDIQIGNCYRYVIANPMRVKKFFSTYPLGLTPENLLHHSYNLDAMFVTSQLMGGNCDV